MLANLQTTRTQRYVLFWAATLATVWVCAGPMAQAQEAVSPAPTESVQPADVSTLISGGPDKWTSPQGLTSALQITLLLTVLSLAPALLLMTTSFVRMLVVLALLRQAVGTQSLPPSQVLTSLALFMTLVVMGPTWGQMYSEGVRPYTAQEINPATGQPFKLMAQKSGDPDEAWERSSRPLRQFMSRQIETAGNSDDIWLFYEYLPADTASPTSYDDVPLQVLLPAFMLSELKVAFLIGFQVYLPFLIVDLVVASVTISMGMLMVPPAMISLPMKLLLFVLVDGWRLIVGMLMESCLS